VRSLPPTATSISRSISKPMSDEDCSGRTLSSRSSLPLGVAPVLPAQRVAEEQRHVAHGTRGAGAQRLADRRELELAVGPLAQYPLVRQRAHQPVDRAGVRADAAGHLVGGQGALASWSGMQSLTAT
jgi:hypothetical protein